MLKLFQSKQRKILGVDIGSASVKLLQMSQNGEQLHLDAYASALFPENAMEGTAIKEIDVVAEVIRHALSLGPFSCKKAAVSVPDSMAISRLMQVNDGLTDSEVEELVMMEASKHIPYPIDEINLDFNVVGPSSKNPSMLDVILVASRAENVGNRVDALKGAGLETHIVDVESFAVERAAQQILASDTEESASQTVALIDIGEIYTHFYAFHNGKMIFSREEEFGGRQLVDAAMQYYQMTRDQVSHGLTEGTMPEDFAQVVLGPYQDTLVIQVKRAIQFFFSTSQHASIDKLLLAGGTTQLLDWVPLLQEHINIPTEMANPFGQMTVASSIDKAKLSKEAPGLLVACGLALRASSS